MKRLRRQANSAEDVKKLLSRIDEASGQLKDSYYALFDNLNALFETYPKLYEEIQMTVKLPTNDDAENVVKFDQDLRDILIHFEDDSYLDSYIDNLPQNNSSNEMPAEETNPN